MKENLLKIVLILALFASHQYAISQPNNDINIKNDTGETGLILPAGFTSTAVVEGLAGARHLVFNKQGGLYVKLSRLKDGKGIVYLKDLKGDGKFVEQAAFGDYPGTGIYIKNDYLYASSNNEVYRYKLDSKGEVINSSEPEKIIVGLVNHNRDNAKSITLDNNGNIYVNVGSYAGGCLLDTASRRAPYPCPLLDSVGGIWQFKTDKLNQQYKDAVHYATGFKHSVALDWNKKTNSLFILQHGRDQMHELYPDFFTTEQGERQPAETMYEVRQGADGGWPYLYYDQHQHKKMLSPEYGGDGKKPATHYGLDPIVAFPAHLAPNGLLFYTGTRFPARYQQGAFISFHAKSAELGKGYFLAFQPFKNGKPLGSWEVFADGFKTDKDLHKPCGIAQAPDGSIYVSDDAKGTIYRIQYKSSR